MNFIDIGKAQGATVHLGGERHGSKGYFIQPTIFTNTTPNMDIVQEEIFGPISCIIKFEDEEGKFFFVTLGLPFASTDNTVDVNSLASIRCCPTSQ